jgi:hypothetical protein
MKKCKGCNNPFTPRFKTTEKYCWEVDCKTKEAMELLEKKRQSDLKARNKEKVEKKKEFLTLSDHLKIAQATFNHFINQRDKGLPCISCNKPINGRVNASHYFNANNHYMVRFDEDNVHSSCITCNQHLSGNLIPYRKYLIEKIGIERFEQLEAKAYLTRKFTIDEVKEINQIYKLKIKEL